MATLNTAFMQTSSIFSVKNNSPVSPQQVEAQLCTFLCQKLDASNVLVDVSGLYNLHDICGANLALNRDLMVNNLAVDTPNFLLEANFVSDLSNVETINYVIGTNTFDSLSNTINKQIAIDASSRALISDTIQFVTTANTGPFNSTIVDGKWKSQFDGEDPDFVLSLAINTQLNNLTNNTSLLSTQEDASFNTEYAIAHYNSQFYKGFTKSTDSYGNVSIAPVNLPLENRLETNNTTIEITDNNLGNISANFGIYSLESTTPNIAIVTSPISSFSALPFVDNSNNPLPSALTQEQFTQLFSSDPSGEAFANGWRFRIEATTPASGVNSDVRGGYYLANGSDANIVTLDNTEILNNYPYMAAGIQNAADQTITITQSPMLIVPTSGSNADNSDSMELTTVGETLGNSDYSTNGNVTIVGFPNDDSRVNVTQNNSDAYNTYRVYYENETSQVGELSEVQKTSQNVGYDVVNTLIPTGHDQYADDHITGISLNNNGSTLYVAGQPDASMSFASDISSAFPSNWATYITIAEYNNLSSDDSVLYIDSSVYDTSNTYHDFSYAVPGATINAYITGVDINTFDSNYQRSYFVSKQVTDLSMVQTNNNWSFLQGASGDAQWLTSNIQDLTRIFPTSSDIASIINTNTSINVTVNYSSETVVQDSNSIVSSSYLYDKVSIAWTDLCGNQQTLTINEKDNHATNLIFTDVSTISTVDEAVTITGTNAKGFDAAVYGGVAHKVTIVDTYYSRFQLPLSGFNNLYLKTPLLKSTLVYYYVEDSNGPHSSSPYLSGFRDVSNQILNASETVVLASNNAPITDTITVGKSAVTCLLGKIQSNDSQSGVWTDESSFVNVDPYFSTESLNTLTDFSGSAVYTTVDPTDYKSTLSLAAYSYQAKLIADAVSNYVVTGYSYNSSTVGSFYTVNPAFSPDFVDGTGIIPVAPSPQSALLNLFIDISSNYSLNNLPTLQLDISVDSSSTPFAIIKTNRSSYISNMTIFHVPKPVFHINETNVQGDDASFNPVGPVSSGNLVVDTGVALKYTNIMPDNMTSFTLNPDKIGVSLLGPAPTPSLITTLTYSAANTETLTIPYYRGYDYSGSLTQTYTINRSSVLPTASFDNSGSYSANLGNIYNQHNPDVSYNGGIGSIGRLPTFLYSRLPASYLTSGVKTIPVNVRGDAVTIRETDASNISTTLLNFPLYNFATTQYLTSIVPPRVTLNDKLNLSGETLTLWEATYRNGGYALRYSSNAFQDPSTATYSVIANITDSEATAGVSFNFSGVNAGGPFNLHTNVTSPTPAPSTSYFVVAPPQIIFTQGNLNSVSNVPFRMDVSAQYDPSGFVTVLADALTDHGATYNPFSAAPATNDVTFTQYFSKSFSQYTYNDGYDSNVYKYNLNNTTNLIVREYPSGLLGSSNTVYSGAISNLIHAQTLDVSLNTATGIYRVKFAQDLASVGITNTDKNIIFNVGNNTLPTDSSSIDVNISGTQVHLISVRPVIVDESNATFDRLHNNFGLQLYKYVFPVVNYTDISSNLIVNVKLTPTQMYNTSVHVPVPTFGSTPYCLPNQLAAIRKTDIQGLSGDVIAWTQDASFNVNLPFNFNLVALDTSGQFDLVRILGVNDTTKTIFTYFTTPDILNIVSADGASVYRVDANGHVVANVMSTSLLKLFQSTAFTSDRPSQPRSNNEFVAYNVDTFTI